MIFVIDANVGLKWFIEEPRSTAARKILEKDNAFIVPDIFIPEICNVVWKKFKNQEITAEQGQAIVTNVPAVIDHIVPTAELTQRAFDLAVQFNHPVYDCLYLALAERESITLITDDAKLVTVGKKAKLGRFVQAL
ncbi:MAG: type II toxin-antitoxin system VapC family toxin [Nitrospirales bacterium]